MEEATVFVWCTTHGEQFMAGAVDAVYANRVTNDFRVKGDKQAAMIALNALHMLGSHIF